MRKNQTATRLVILGVVLLSAGTLRAPSAFGQAIGTLSVSSIPQGWDCGLGDDGAGIKSAYVIHRAFSGTQGCRFRLAMDPGVTMTYLSEVHYTQATGNTQEGMVACYGECVTEDVLVATVYYMSFGSTYNCSDIRIVPHPDAQTVDAVACFDYPARLLTVQDLRVYSMRSWELRLDARSPTRSPARRARLPVRRSPFKNRRGAGSRPCTATDVEGCHVGRGQSRP